MKPVHPIVVGPDGRLRWPTTVHAPPQFTWRYSLATLLTIMLLCGVVLGVYKWLVPPPVTYPAMAIVNRDKQVGKFMVWVYAEPVSKRYRSDQQMYEAKSWSLQPHPGATVVDTGYHYQTWWREAGCKGPTGEYAMLMHPRTFRFWEGIPDVEPLMEKEP